MWDNQSYLIDSYLTVKEGFSLLRIKVANKDQPIKIPDFLQIKREVTGENGYKSKYLTKRNWYIPPGDETLVNSRKDSN